MESPPQVTAINAHTNLILAQFPPPTRAPSMIITSQHDSTPVPVSTVTSTSTSLTAAKSTNTANNSLLSHASSPASLPPNSPSPSPSPSSQSRQSPALVSGAGTPNQNFTRNACSPSSSTFGPTSSAELPAPSASPSLTMPRPDKTDPDTDTDTDGDVRSSSPSNVSGVTPRSRARILMRARDRRVYTSLRDPDLGSGTRSGSGSETDTGTDDYPSTSTGSSASNGGSGGRGLASNRAQSRSAHPTPRCPASVTGTEMGVESDTELESDMEFEIAPNPDMMMGVRPSALVFSRAELVFTRPLQLSSLPPSPISSLRAGEGDVVEGEGECEVNSGGDNKREDATSQTTEHVTQIRISTTAASPPKQVHFVAPGTQEQLDSSSNPNPNVNVDVKSRRPRLALPLRLPSTVNPTAGATRRPLPASRIFPAPVFERGPNAIQPPNRVSQAQHQNSKQRGASDTVLNEASMQPDLHQDQDHRTPNVYINGLPPQCPESALYTLTCAFGEVRSVRTFTRHVCGRASGYGFVLFDTVEAAERCIEALRHYRNLHPSFSKQMHKIPGTPYAPPSSTGSMSPRSGVRSGGSFGGGVGGTDIDGESAEGRTTEMADNTFRERMEKLGDETSTNLYFEGLPLSIDEPTLTALVSPFSIKSSRFFQTKLSEPPKIIAFVRLESRQAAEDIIERLHGRMVRGWNDPGCRISVRFADSAEQREMRRTERVFREGELSPNRLTIAQAALLNLRGQDLQLPQPLTRHHRPALPTCNSDDFKVTPRPVSRYYSTHPEALSSNATPSPQYIQLRDLQTDSNPDTVAGLESMRAGRALSDGSSGPYVSHARAWAPAVYHTPAPVPAQAQTETRSGFTLAEERILQAHETGQHPHPQQPRPGGETSLHARSSFPRLRVPNVVWQVPHAQTAFPPQDLPVFSPIAPTGTMSEEDFHATAQGRLHPSSYQRPHHCQIDMTSGNTVHSPIDFSFAPSPSDAPYSHNHDRPQQHNVPISSEQNAKYQISQAHMRSTTLPSSQFNQRPYRPRQHHSSISFPPSNSNNSNRVRSTNYINTNNYHEHGNSNSANPNHNLRLKDEQIISNNYDSTHFRATLQTIHDDSETDNSPLVSPSLTYSSRTPSTLSPATPFFGSFTHAQENFKIPQENFEGLGTGHLTEKQARFGSQ